MLQTLKILFPAYAAELHLVFNNIFKRHYYCFSLPTKDEPVKILFDRRSNHSGPGENELC